jgi:hypothetical protein
MKTLLFYVVLFLLVLTTSCSLLKSSSETISEVARKVESKDFTVVVNYANPLRMRQVYLTSEYDLRIKNDSAFAFLPYYGVSQVAPFDTSEGGIKFAEPMTNYSIVPNKKANGWKITFRVKTKLTVYDVFLDVFSGGSASFSVNSYERDRIDFTGEVVLSN